MSAQPPNTRANRVAAIEAWIRVFMKASRRENVPGTHISGWPRRRVRFSRRPLESLSARACSMSAPSDRDVDRIAVETPGEPHAYRFEGRRSRARLARPRRRRPVVPDETREDHRAVRPRRPRRHLCARDRGEAAGRARAIVRDRGPSRRRGHRRHRLGGQVQMMFDAITTMAPNVRAGKLRALGTSGKVRSSVLPEVPTLSEAGVPGYDAVIWLGIMAPAGTPRAIVERLNNEITRAANSPEMKETWAKQGAVAMSMTPEEFGRYMREDIDKWARVVKISGAKPDQ